MGNHSLKKPEYEHAMCNTALSVVSSTRIPGERTLRRGGLGTISTRAGARSQCTSCGQWWRSWWRGHYDSGGNAVVLELFLARIARSVRVMLTLHMPVGLPVARPAAIY